MLHPNRLTTSSLPNIIEEIRSGENHWASGHAEDGELEKLHGLTSLKGESEREYWSGRKLATTLGDSWPITVRGSMRPVNSTLDCHPLSDPASGGREY